MKYSIITINYNNRDGLEKTILSVINQTCQDFEYIIIDGGSTDGSVDVIKKYAYRIDYWVSEPDKGIYNAMNKGILQAHGEYLNFMNSGDCFYNNNILNQFKDRCDADIIYGNVLWGNVLHTYPPNMSFHEFCIHGYNHQSTFFNAKIFTKYLYDEDLKIVSDWKLFALVLLDKAFIIKHVEEIIAIFDMNGISSNREKREEETQSVLKEILPLPLFLDYQKWSKINSPIIELLPQLSKTNRLHKLIYKLINYCIFIRNILINF